jgi:nicotinate-nucleotide adenylyltransferase
MRIGLLGGSFNPPHEGHVHASEVALKYLKLDAVWWLVSPGNPLKDNSGLPDLQSRIDQSRLLTSDPRILMTGIEKDFGTRRSLDTIKALQKYFPQTDFVWLAGTDIAFQMHRWHRWKKLLDLLPLAFVGRPTRFGWTRKNALRELAPVHHVHLQNGMKPAFTKRTVFWLYGHKLNPMSSTHLRAK